MEGLAKRVTLFFILYFPSFLLTSSNLMPYGDKMKNKNKSTTQNKNLDTHRKQTHRCCMRILRDIFSSFTVSIHSYHLIYLSSLLFSSQSSSKTVRHIHRFSSLLPSLPPPYSSHHCSLLTFFRDQMSREYDYY